MGLAMLTGLMYRCGYVHTGAQLKFLHKLGIEVDVLTQLTPDEIQLATAKLGATLDGRQKRIETD